MEMIKDIIINGIRIDTCGHIVTATVPRTERTKREDFDKALAREMKKPCRECK